MWREGGGGYVEGAGLRMWEGHRVDVGGGLGRSGGLMGVVSRDRGRGTENSKKKFESNSNNTKKNVFRTFLGIY